MKECKGKTYAITTISVLGTIAAILVVLEYLL